jgi:hypothetical protein
MAKIMMKDSTLATRPCFSKHEKTEFASTEYFSCIGSTSDLPNQASAEFDVWLSGGLWGISIVVSRGKSRGPSSHVIDISALEVLEIRLPIQ